MTINTVIKKDGTEVPFDAEKLNKMAEWADNIGLCWSELALSAIKKVTDKCSTVDIQNALIESCAEKGTHEHLQMAARLFVGSLYKTVHGGFNNQPTLKTFYHKMVDLGVWEVMDYTDEQLEEIEILVDHSKDLTYKYSTMKQLSGKYAKKYKGLTCETPQFTFIGIAMKLMEVSESSRRLEDIEKYYNLLSDLTINPPTPSLTNLRTPFKGLASCAVVLGEDDADSLGTASSIAYRMTCANAGLGMTLRTRTLGDPIRGGEITHTGKIPYYRGTEGMVKSTKQSTRGGSATMHYTILDPEIESLLRLKHPTTVRDKQVRGLDYSVGVNRYFMERAARGDTWMLISLLHGRDVHDALHGSYEVFKIAYEAYEKSDKPRTYVDARTLLSLAAVQRQDTGRVYLHWLDEMNVHTPFKEKIYSSNL